jgi:hypothetical protein
MNRRVTKNGLRFLLAASLATFVGCSKSDADETSAGSESTGGSDCLEINEGAGGEDCDSTMCGPGEYCLGGGICELGCRKTVTCAMGEYCDLSTADPITAGTCREPTASQDVCGEAPTTAAGGDCQSACYLKLGECALAPEGTDSVAACQDLCGRTTQAQQDCLFEAICADLQDGQECGVVLFPTMGG